MKAILKSTPQITPISQTQKRKRAAFRTAQPNVRHASACRQDWELSMCDVTGNHCFSDANLYDQLKHVGHLVASFV